MTAATRSSSSHRPSVCGQEHFDEIEQILRSVLTEAWSMI